MENTRRSSSPVNVLDTVYLYGFRISIPEFNDPQKLIEGGPPRYSRERAKEEVHKVMMDYVKKYLKIR